MANKELQGTTFLPANNKINEKNLLPGSLPAFKNNYAATEFTETPAKIASNNNNWNTARELAGASVGKNNVNKIITDNAPVILKALETVSKYQQLGIESKNKSTNEYKTYNDLKERVKDAILKVIIIPEVNKVTTLDDLNTIVEFLFSLSQSYKIDIPISESIRPTIITFLKGEIDKAKTSEKLKELNKIINTLRPSTGNYLFIGNEFNELRHNLEKKIEATSTTIAPEQSPLSTLTAATNNTTGIMGTLPKTSHLGPLTFNTSPSPIPVSSGITALVKNPVVPLMYDMEKCELVVKADKKGLMTGYLEAHAPSLKLLSEQVMKLVSQQAPVAKQKNAVKEPAKTQKAIAPKTSGWKLPSFGFGTRKSPFTSIPAPRTNSTKWTVNPIGKSRRRTRRAVRRANRRY